MIDAFLFAVVVLVIVTILAMAVWFYWHVREK